MSDANAQFAIEIAATMGGSEQTLGELDELVSSFTGAGKNADLFQDAIKQVSAQLDIARGAQEAANVALSKGQAEYALLETAALQASKAAEKLARGGMTREFLEASQKAAEAEAAVDAYGGSLRALEVNAAGAAREEEHLAQTLDNVKKLGGHADKVIAKQAESLSKLGGALGAVGGPLGSLGQKLTAPVKGFTELSGVMGSTNAAAVLATVGIVALGAAILATAAAAVYGLAKITLWAVKLADKEGRLAAQTDRLSSNFDELFSGLNIEPVIDGMTVLADLFDRNTAAGETMALAFEGVFQPIVDNATAAAYAVEAFVLGFLIGATKLYIALKPVIKGIAEFFGFDDPSLSLSFETITEIGQALAPVILGIAAAFAATVAVVGLFVGGLTLLIGLVAALPAMFIHMGVTIVSGVIDAFTRAVDFVKGLDFVQLGLQMMQGLAAGVMNGAGAVVNAISGAVKGAINAAKSLLGIASPSKVFADIGVNTGEGMTSGVEETTADVHGAYQEMVAPDVALAGVESPAAQLAAADATVASIPSPLDAPGKAPAESTGGAGGGGARRDYSGAVFNFHGVAGAEDAVQTFREMLLMSDEELALSLGAGEAASP